MMNLPFSRNAVFYHEDETNCLLLITPQRHWPFFSPMLSVESRQCPQIHFKQDQLEASPCMRGLEECSSLSGTLQAPSRAVAEGMPY